MNPEGWLIVVSDTGPLVSMFQSDSLALVTSLLGVIHTSETCLRELLQHGWEDAVTEAGNQLVRHELSDPQRERAQALARQIASHSDAKDEDFLVHLGEAEAMVLAQDLKPGGGVLLVDELAARRVAMSADITGVGFAGVLLLAVEAGLLTPRDVRERLEHCRRHGTHYSPLLIERVYQAAKEARR